MLLMGKKYRGATRGEMTSGHPIRQPVAHLPVKFAVRAAQLLSHIPIS